MQLTQPTSEIYVPDAVPSDASVARTTHMAIAAHQDDLEIMALDGILPCFGQADQWFPGVIVTDGAGSPRDGLYAKYTDAEMRAIRRVEQKKSAFVGEYGAAVFLDHPSAGVKNVAASGPRPDLLNLLRAARPRIVYTHSLADKHDTHVAVAIRTIAAIRELAPQDRPENLAVALLGVFDSQIAGGKRYDLATFGRRRAHATYHQSHGVDAAQMINFGMDLTPLVLDASLDIAAFVEEHITRFSNDVSACIGKAL